MFMSLIGHTPSFTICLTVFFFIPFDSFSPCLPLSVCVCVCIVDDNVKTTWRATFPMTKGENGDLFSYFSLSTHTHTMLYGKMRGVVDCISTGWLSIDYKARLVSASAWRHHTVIHAPVNTHTRAREEKKNKKTAQERRGKREQEQTRASYRTSRNTSVLCRSWRRQRRR